ncbi:RNA polymerase sigma factor [Singulisphaera rosea]
MTGERETTSLKDIRTLFSVGMSAELTDGQLLERLVTRRGEEAGFAFAAVIERHGPMVLRTCLSVARHDHDAQDAFQAIFFILARRARSLWVRDPLGPWLHRVAFRVAVRARVAKVRRQEAEIRMAVMLSEDIAERTPLDLRPVLHEEVERWPHHYRLPIVLCDLEGRTYEEAARCLRCPVGTIKSRLTRAREKPRTRLVRRGLAPTAGSLGLIGANEAISATIPSALIVSTRHVALRFLVAPGAARRSVSPSVAIHGKNEREHVPDQCQGFQFILRRDGHHHGRCRPTRTGVAAGQAGTRSGKALEVGPGRIAGDEHRERRRGR